MRECFTSQEQKVTCQFQIRTFQIQVNEKQSADLNPNCLISILEEIDLQISKTSKKNKQTMEVKTLARNNTISSINKKLVMKLESRQLSVKKMLATRDLNRLEPLVDVERFMFGNHPAAKLLRGSQPSPAEFRKFISMLYRGLHYSINNLKGPSEEYLKKKKVKLPEPKDLRKKFLILDLDETLIHSVFTNEKTDVKFIHKGDEFKFNVRPYCIEFLEVMSEFYSIYVFTAGTQDYAEPIVNYLNQKKKTILGVLHRKNCMQTHNGFFIKDLRIISNKQLKDIVIVDNLVHSFGLQLENGIPILEFLDNKNDKELKGIESILKELARVDDVRVHLREKLKLREVLQINELDFMEIENFKLKC